METSSQPSLKIVVATHKSYWMPEDPVYLPVFAGAAGKPDLGYARDDAGENISQRNPNYCELTALYWAWKNVPAECLGLVHYRRHFKGRRGVASGDEIRARLAGRDVLVPRKRNYYIESTYSQYVHAHHAQDLDLTRDVIAARSPEALAAFDRVMGSTKGHRFNMFVMRRPVLDRYCSWLFDILFELERRLDISAYSPYDARVFGFVAERLLDVWLLSNRVSCSELPVLNLESQHWPTKIWKFLGRKFGGRSGRTDGGRT